MISAQFSIYPLGQDDLGPAIDSACQSLASWPVRYKAGTMSTLVEGHLEDVFAAIQAAFVAASGLGATVMTCTISNACPVALSETTEAHVD